MKKIVNRCTVLPILHDAQIEEDLIFFIVDSGQH